MKYQAVSAKADTFGRWIAIALGFSIPLSTALDNILIGLFVVCWMLGAGFPGKWHAIRSNKIAILSLALFALFLAGVFNPDAPIRDGLKYLNKYKELLLLPLLIPLFKDTSTRRHGLIGFGAAIALSLVLSYLIHFGLLPWTTMFHAEPGDPVAFKKHITQSLLTALGAFLFAVAARHEATGWKRTLLWALAALAVYNVLFMLQGRIGYLVLAALLIYLGFDWLRWKGMLAGIFACAVVGIVAFHASSGFHQRILKAAEEFSGWRQQNAAGKEDSIGLRLEWYKNGLEIVRDHPLFGVGTGGFPKAYAEKTKGSGRLETTNPHNQYLLTAIQIGLPGLALLLYLFYCQFRLARALPSVLERNLALGLMLTISIGCLFNSLLVDHTERVLYAWMSALLYSGLRPNSENTRIAT